MPGEGGEGVRAQGGFTAPVPPDDADLLQRHAPGAFAAWLAASEDVLARRELDLATKELVFVVLAVVGGDLAGAKAHAEAGLKAGLTPGMIMEALSIALLSHGHHIWATAGAALMRHVEAVKGARP